MSTSKNKVVLKPQLTFKNLMLMFLVRKTPYDDPEEDICPSLANCLQRDFTQAKLAEMMGKYADETVSIHDMLYHLLTFLFSGETYIENFLMYVKEIKKITPTTEKEAEIIYEIDKLHKHIKAQRVSTGNLCSNRYNYMTFAIGNLTSSRQNYWKNIFVKIFTQCDIIAKLIASYNQEK